MARTQVIISTSLDAIREQLTLENIPYINNNCYAVNLKDSTRGLFALKEGREKSLLEILDESEQYSVLPEAAAKAREWYINLKNETMQLAKESGNCAYEELLSAFEQKEFQGLILCGQEAELKQPSDFGMTVLLGDVQATAVIMTVTGLEFLPERIDVSRASLYGRIIGVPSIGNYGDMAKSFSLKVKRIEALVQANKVLYAGIRCTLSLYRIFGATASMSELELYGVYQQMSGAVTGIKNYSFTCGDKHFISLQSGYLEELEPEHIVMQMKEVEQGISAVLNCSGKMRFGLQEEGYDLFSYGWEHEDREKKHIVTDKGLQFEGLRILFRLHGMESSMQVDVTQIKLIENGREARNDSFCGQFACSQFKFISSQGGIMPDKLGYGRILTPFAQKRLEKEWYGISFKLKVFGSLVMEVLFAFEDKKLYVGGKIADKAAGGRLTVQTGTPFDIQVKSLMMTASHKENKLQYALLMKGVQLSLFGIKVPDGNCNLFLSGDGNGNSGWYAVYGGRRK